MILRLYDLSFDIVKNSITYQFFAWSPLNIDGILLKFCNVQGHDEILVHVSMISFSDNEKGI